MKRNILLLGLSLLTIVGCSSTSSNNEDSLSELSSEDKTSISSSSISMEEEIATFKKYLKSKEGNVNKRDLSVYNNVYYMTTGSDPFEFHTLDRSTTVRYDSSSVDVINVRNGSFGSLNDDTGEYDLDLNYVMQTYCSGKYVYNVCDYDSEAETDYYQKVTKSANYLNEFDLGLTQYISSDFDALLSYSSSDNYKVTYEGFNYNGTKDFSFSYSLTAYDQSTKSKTEEMIVSFDITFKNGYISNAYEILEDNLYVGGTKVNWRRSVFNFDYYQGEFGTYEGDILDYSNYSPKQ